MSKAVLSLENLGELDGGRAAGIINAALKQAVSDLDDRGDDFKAREVTITVRMEKSEKSGHVFATVVGPPTRSSSASVGCTPSRRTSRTSRSTTTIPRTTRGC